MSTRMSEARWAALKTSFLSGVTAKELERQYSVPARTIYSRSTRQKWREAGLAGGADVAHAMLGVADQLRSLANDLLARSA